ncbi:MAG: ParB N-terminal domain-containing protein [Gordonibacter sp.]|uniref:ParB/RepB/Spo0J family partition protein n=1 Tax=Gordonibacter sp. TaxID=1968902 RepID=UPI002FC6C177
MCAKANPAASGFSITGLLDTQSKTRERFPVVEIEVAAIADHPNNAIYSMDDIGIEKLAASIKEHGLTDLPLVRKIDDGSWQMLSGHRRKAAYLLLSGGDAAYAKMPCRIVGDVTDAQALLMLHSANFFTRQLSASEFAAASAALGEEVLRRRAADPSLRGRRTEDIKAEIIQEQTGQKVSGKTIKRKEQLDRKINFDLLEEWRQDANDGSLSASAIDALAALSESEQARIHADCPADVGKRELSAFVMERAKDADACPDKRLAKAAGLLEKCLEGSLAGDELMNSRILAAIASHAQKLSEACEHPKDATNGA